MIGFFRSHILTHTDSHDLSFALFCFYPWSINAAMAVGCETNTKAEADITHEKENNVECAHVEHSDGRAVMADGDPETDQADLVQTEKTLVRKLDWVILPVLWIMYWFK